MNEFPLNKLVEVLWTDICTHNNGWQSLEVAREGANLMNIKTVGYVLAETAKILKLTMMQAPTNDGEVGVVAVIPKGVISRYKILKGL